MNSSQRNSAVPSWDKACHDHYPKVNPMALKCSDWSLASAFNISLYDPGEVDASYESAIPLLRSNDGNWRDRLAAGQPEVLYALIWSLAGQPSIHGDASFLDDLRPARVVALDHSY